MIIDSLSFVLPFTRSVHSLFSKKLEMRLHWKPTDSCGRDFLLGRSDGPSLGTPGEQPRFESGGVSTAGTVFRTVGEPDRILPVIDGVQLHNAARQPCHEM